LLIVFVCSCVRVSKQFAMLGKAMRFVTVCTLAFAICGKANRDKSSSFSEGTTEDLEHRFGQETNSKDLLSTTMNVSSILMRKPTSETSKFSVVRKLAAILALSSALTSADAFASPGVQTSGVRPFKKDSNTVFAPIHTNNPLHAWAAMGPSIFDPAIDDKGMLSELGGKPYLRELRCDPASDASVREVASRICPSLLRGLGEIGDLKVVKVSGGITNQMRLVTGVGEGPDVPSVLLRVFGADGVIDRDVETPTFEALAERLGRPGYIGRFANGRAEEWLHGYRAMTLGDLNMPAIAKRIAEALASLHRFEVPPHLSPFSKSSGSLWGTVREWYTQASSPETKSKLAALSDADVALLSDPALDMTLIGRAVDELQARSKKDGKLVFCHNDLTPQNLMLDEDTGDVRIIDLEYGDINYAAFDVANHFMEYSGGTDSSVKVLGVPEYERLPGEAARRAFCEAYLVARDGIDSASAAAVQDFLEEVDIFVAIDHVYWGLWAVNQARIEGTAEFPYLLYGKSRLARGLADGGFL